MRRRLWLIDLTLLAAIVFTGYELRLRWEEGRRREEALLKQMVRVPPPPTVAPLEPMTPSRAEQYMDVAQHVLFARDRSPSVILDPPAPPPPPKPLPQLPVSYGVMDLGAGPAAILSEKPGAPHRSYRAGEKIGEFKVVALNNYEIVFEWEGKYLKRKFEDLADKRAPIPQQQAAPAQASAGAAQAQTTAIGAGSSTPAGPGVDLGNAARACQPGDSAAPGTVQGGLRKVVSKTPFGDSCRWEPVK